MTIGTNYSQMQYNYDPSMYGTVSNTTKGTTYLNVSASSDSYSSSNDNTCTDGKDDGKIGFFSAIGNAIQGVGKTIVNGVKGMFTNKEGKFSLGKTLLTIGTAALCVAVPAVGVAACAVGGVMGAVQVGKGIGKAVTAETDAEAKQAWEDIGGGTFGVAMSVVGVKSGMKAVGKSSTAGLANLDDAAAAAAKANGKTSALSQLDDAATFGQKAKAFKNDMISSTQNSWKNVKTTYNQRVDYKKAKADLDDASTNFEKAKKNGWNEETYQAADDIKNAQDRFLAAEENYKYAGVEQKVANAVKHPIKSIKQIGDTANSYSKAIRAEIQQKRLSNKMKNWDVDNLTSKQQKVFDNATDKILKTSKGAKSEHVAKVADISEKISQNSSTSTGKLLDSAKTQMKNTKGLSAKWDLVKSKINKSSLNKIKDSLSSDGKEILTKLNSNENVNSLINKYGYESVQQTIATVAGTELGVGYLNEI